MSRLCSLLETPGERHLPVAHALPRHPPVVVVRRREVRRHLCVRQPTTLESTKERGADVERNLRAAADAGLSPAKIAKRGGHSLRAGFVTQAFRNGAQAHEVMRQTGHKNPATLEIYTREHNRLKGNAVAGFEI